MDSSKKALYDTLGAYVDNLSNSLYLGTAKGEISISNGNGKSLMTPEIMPLIDIFYADGAIELFGFWCGGACRLKTSTSKIGIRYRSGSITLNVEPHGSLTGGAEIVLLAGRGLAETLRRTITEERGRECCGVISSSMK